MNITRTASIAAVGIIAAALLSGCTPTDMTSTKPATAPTAPVEDAATNTAATAGGGDVIAKNDKGLPFVFDRASVTAPGTEKSVNGVNVAIPNDLKSAVGKTESAKLPINGFVLTPHKLEGVKYCAVDVAIDYANKAAFTKGVTLVTEQGVLYRDDSPDGEAIAHQEVKYTPEMALRIAVLNAHHMTTPGQLILTSVGGGPYVGDADLTRAKLDESAPEEGAYLTEDMSEFTIVTRCSPNPADDAYQIKLQLPVMLKGDTDEPYGTFASVTASVMIDGTISVAGEAEDYQRDANGNWIAS